MTKYTAENIRDGIFDLYTRRFGTVAENLIKILANTSWGQDLTHDLFDDISLERIEVKFSRALKANESTINENNILDEIIAADNRARMFKSTEWEKYGFDCNIQQIKRKEFDILYYGIFFSDKIQIFKIKSGEIGKAIKYSDKQHRGNVGEGQFHLNNGTYAYHLENHFEKELTYKQILKMLKKIKNADTQKGKIISKILIFLIP